MSFDHLNNPLDPDASTRPTPVHGTTKPGNIALTIPPIPFAGWSSSNPVLIDPNVENVRVSNELVVYDGISYVGVEVAKERSGDLYFDPALLVDRKIPIGKDNFGKVIVWDLDNHNTPHALICGATGSGK